MTQYGILYRNTFGRMPETARKRHVKRSGKHRTKIVQVTPVVNENGILPVQRHPRTFLGNVKFYLTQFSEATTIHGIRYIGERGRSILERVIWTIIVVTVCVLCVYLIRKSYIKWKTSPVIMTFATEEITIGQIPFPAVTVCPETKFNPKIFNFTEMVRRKRLGLPLTHEEIDHLHLSYLVCRDTTEYTNFFLTSTLNRTYVGDVPERLFEMQPDPNPMNLTEIKWIDTYLNFSEALIRSVTTQGVCRTFNMMAYDDMLRHGNMFKRRTTFSRRIRNWSLKHGYHTKDHDGYPLRTFTPGIDGGLTIDSLVTNSSHLEDLCEGSLQGFKVVIHPTAEFPNMEKHIKLPLDSVVNIAVKPSVVLVSKELREYSPKERKCYFFDEKYLAAYNFYTQQNCMDECLANYTRARCGCVPFYFPPYGEQVDVCGPGSSECVDYSKLKYLELEEESGLGAQRCGCLPSCTSLSYEVETSQMDWNWKRFFYVVQELGYVLSNGEALNNAHLSTLNDYYKNLNVHTCERQELIGLVDFISDVGGLLGLCIGFSVTSAIEILYFFTLRIVCNVRKYGEGKWSGDSQSAKPTK